LLLYYLFVYPFPFAGVFFLNNYSLLLLITPSLFIGIEQCADLDLIISVHYLSIYSCKYDDVKRVFAKTLLYNKAKIHIHTARNPKVLVDSRIGLTPNGTHPSFGPRAVTERVSATSKTKNLILETSYKTKDRANHPRDHSSSPTVARSPNSTLTVNIVIKHHDVR